MRSALNPITQLSKKRDIQTHSVKMSLSVLSEKEQENEQL